MAQRHSEYPRQAHERYVAPLEPVQVLAPWLRCHGVKRVLDVDRDEATMSRHLRTLGFDALRVGGDFLAYAAMPTGAHALIVNPPYGADRGGRLACRFLRHALSLRVPVLAALVAADFDSASTRTDLFRDEPRFAGKFTLLKRVVWFARPGAKPSTNHVWLLWREEHRGPPQIKASRS